MSAIQTELFSPTAEDFGIPCIDVPRSDWAIDCAPPVQDRSLAEWREISIARANDTRPKKIDRDRFAHTQKLGTVSEELGTVSEELGTVSEELGTVSEESPTANSPQPPTVPNCRSKHALPGMYREWRKCEWYWRMKVYVDGERKTYHLHKDYDRAVAIGKKILDRLGEKK
jgi:hypothetical protein